jgi:hypothetical protein
MSIRRWLPDPPDFGPFHFGPAVPGKLPCIVVCRDDGRGHVQVINPAFGSRRFETREAANAWMQAKGYGHQAAPKRHPGR